MISRTPERITLIPFKKQFARELLITIAGVAGGLLAVPLPSGCDV